MSFLTELQKDTNKQSYTANGAISNTSTLDPLLDFFSNAGAMRGREADAVALFNKAYAVDKANAIRCLFYLRDIRGGQGERSVFRAIMESLDEKIVAKIVEFIPEYGRWDEVPYTKDGIALIKKQFEQDRKDMKAGKSVSLLAKWLPSDNASSFKSKEKARLIAQELGLTADPIVLDNGRWIPDMTPYRKEVARLRKYIDLLEQKMSAKEWGEIQYDKLPSQAHRKHVQAFKRHDAERYTEYIGQVERGEKKINVDTLFTYEVFDMVKSGHDAEANAMWKNLPDYTNGQNALVLADVSGSMTGRPMSISVSLALYFAERNEGPFKDHFMTFTSNSRLQKITGNSLTEKLHSIESSDWHGSTNIQSAFDAILAAALTSKATPDEMPKMLYIISDMQFDSAVNRSHETNFETAERKFREAGYELPHVVFWNCSAWGDDAPATMYDNRVTLISGANQSTFQYVLEGKTPVESMLDILNSDRYSKIVV